MQYVAEGHNQHSHADCVVNYRKWRSQSGRWVYRVKLDPDTQMMLFEKIANLIKQHSTTVRRSVTLNPKAKTIEFRLIQQASTYTEVLDMVCEHLPRHIARPEELTPMLSR